MKLKSNKLNAGYSLTETLLVIAIFTLIITIISGSTITFYKSFGMAEKNSEKIDRTAAFFKNVSEDVLSPDIHPHRLPNMYKFGSSSITFYANKHKVEYDFTDKVFVLKKGKKRKAFKIIKNFEIKYYDKNEFEIAPADNFPYYCTMYFITYNNEVITLDMRL